MVKKIIMSLVLLFAIFGVEYKVFNQLIDNNQEKTKKVIDREVNNIKSYIELRGNKISSLNEVLNLSNNLIKVSKETILHELPIENFKIKNKLFYITLVDETKGKVRTLKDKVYVSLNNVQDSIEIYINELNKENELIKTKKVVELETYSEIERKFDKYEYDFLMKPYELNQVFTIKDKNKIITTYKIKISKYNLDKKYLESITEIFMYLNIFILVMFAGIIYLLFNKNIMSMDEDNKDNLVKKLKNNFNKLNHKKDKKINLDLINGNTQVYTKTVKLLNKETNLIEENLIIDMLIKTDKTKLLEIDNDKIESHLLSKVNKALFDFVISNEIKNEDICIPIYINNISNNEFINWLEYLIVKTHTENIKLYLKGINKETIPYLEKILLRFKNQKLSIVFDEIDTNRLNKEELALSNYYVKDKHE